MMVVLLLEIHHCALERERMSSTKKEMDPSTYDRDGDTLLSSSLNNGNNNNICCRISMSHTIETSLAGIKIYEALQQQDLQQQQQNHQPFEGIEQFLLYDEDNNDEYDGDELGTIAIPWQKVVIKATLPFKNWLDTEESSSQNMAPSNNTLDLELSGSPNNEMTATTTNTTTIGIKGVGRPMQTMLIAVVHGVAFSNASITQGTLSNQEPSTDSIVNDRNNKDNDSDDDDEYTMMMILLPRHH
jgi:hypothetical protein